MVNYCAPMVEEIVQQHFANSLVKWHVNKGVRDGKVHASTLLQDEDSWCVREPVLSIFFKKRLEEKYAFQLPALKYGWVLHEMKQEAISQVVEGEAKEDYEALIQMAYPHHEDEDTMDDATRLRYWRDLFKEDGCLALEVEKTHKEAKYGLMGFTPDAIIQTKISGQLLTAILEIKGYADEVYQRALKDPFGCSEFRDAVKQANFYMHLTGIHLATILFESKGNQRKFFIKNIKYDAEMAAPYWAHYEEVVQYTAIYKKEGCLPMRHADCSSLDAGRAKNCPMSAACFETPEGRQKLRRSDG